MKTKLLLLLFFSITLGLTNAHAQSNAYRDTVGTRVYFRQGQSRIDLGYRSNRADLRAFIDRLREAFNDPNQRVGVVRIVGGASPEGRTDLNKALSSDRAESVENWLRSNLPYPVKYETSSVGIDWEGLTRLVEAATNMPYRNEVLYILKNTPEWIRDRRTNEIVDGRKRRLGMLAGGNAWRWMEEHLFEELRSGGMGVSCEITYINPPTYARSLSTPDTDKDTVYVRDTLTYYYSNIVTQTDTIYLGKQKANKRAQRAAASEENKQPFYMSLKTNFLTHALLVPNIGLEVSLGKGWSIGANGMYSWWDTDNLHYGGAVKGGVVNLRKYLSWKHYKKPLTGHHVGLYGYAVDYDFAFGGKAYASEKWNYSAGVEYGYSLPIGKSFNLDFSIGFGYLESVYGTYTLETNSEGVQSYAYVESLLNRWIGPTKAEVSLIWLIGFGKNRR